MKAAFKLIGDFKGGLCELERSISACDQALLRLLHADLLPQETLLDADLSQLIAKVAREDTHWNQRSMRVIDEIYSLLSTGKVDDAYALRDEFLRECPSVWYRQIVSSA